MDMTKKTPMRAIVFNMESIHANVESSNKQILEIHMQFSVRKGDD